MSITKNTMNLQFNILEIKVMIIFRTLDQTL